MITLYDAERCPYCARTRIALAEKGLEYEVVDIDLDDRPAWIYDKNPLGRVPVIEEDDFVLAESAVINEYLEERYPEPALWPPDPAERALGRLLVHRFDRLGKPYYALRRGEEGARKRLDERLAVLDGLLGSQEWVGGRMYGLADIAYVPWILRMRELLGIEVEAFPALDAWLARIAERPAVAAEAELVAGLRV